MGSLTDRRWIGAALALAERGRGRTAPNPNVGCLIVADDRVVGRGWTQPGGRPHAEAMALAEAGAKSRGATCYVTLEPCAHESPRGPACADLLIASGIGVAAFFCFMFSWVELLLSRTLTSVNAKPIAATMTRTVSASGLDWGVLAAAGVLTILPGALVIWFVRNYIAKGFALGRV